MSKAKGSATESKQKNKEKPRIYRYLCFEEDVESKAHNPHDLFLKRSLKERRVCLEMFNRELPEGFRETVDIEAYELVHTTHVHDNLETHFTDALFKFPRRDDSTDFAYSYMLFEGLRQYDKLMPLRLMGYMLDIAEDHIRVTGRKEIPLIKTLVFYNGEVPLESPLELKRLINGPEALVEEMFQRFHVLDVGREDKTTLLKDLWFGFMALAMGQCDEEDAIAFIKEYGEQIKAIKQAGGNRWIAAVSNYLFSVDKKGYTKREIIAAVQELDPALQEDIVTTAEVLKEEGRMEGREEGRIESAITMAKRMFKKGFSQEEVRDVTDLPEEKLRDLFKSNQMPGMA